MKLIYSLKSHLYKNVQTSFPSHLSMFEHILFHIASYQTNKRWFNKTEFITDNIGKEILIDTIGLQFDSVRTDLENESDLFKLPTFGKVFAYSIQEEPFMHCDYDMFWFKAPPEAITSAPVACQNRESGIYFDIYKPGIAIADHFINKPKYWDPELKHTYNLGFLAANDLNFIKEYTEGAMQLAQNFQQCTPDMGNDLLFEQYYFGCALKHRKVNCFTLLPEETDGSLTSINDINQDNAFGYKHYFGYCKGTPDVLTWLNDYVRCNWPNLYRNALPFKP